MIDEGSLSALLWLALFTAYSVLVARAAAKITTLRERWTFFALIALLPLLAPSRGLLSTLLTGLCVVFAARLPDLEKERQRTSPFELGLWLVVPVYRDRPRTRAPANLQRALGYVSDGTIRLLLCALLTFALRNVSALGVPWWIRASALIVFFVWLMTGLADLLSAQLELTGRSAEPVFDRPLRSRSPREFWSRRWNRFISRFALRHVALEAQARGLGKGSQNWFVFLASALFHEYFAIGVAGTHAVLGTMSVFFLLQGAALAVLARTQLRVQFPTWVGQVLTFAWMAATCPLFFQSVYRPLLTLGYPEPWLPHWFVRPSGWSQLF